MKKTNFLFGLSLFGLALTACGGGTQPSEHTHQWRNPTYQWANDYSSCTARRECELDSSHVESETASSTYVDTVQPTTTSDGERVYTVTFSKEYFETQTKTVVVPAIGHEHTFSDEWEYDETHHWHPSTCGHDVKGGYAEHQFDVVTEDGVTTYSCECGYHYTVGGNKFLEYEDNPEFVEKFPELNAALKELLNHKNFTMEHNKVYPEGTYYYNQHSENPLIVFVTGTLSSFAKFDHKDYEAGVSFSGELFLSLEQVLSRYSVASWEELLQNPEKCNILRSNIIESLSSAGEILSLATSIDLNNAVISEGKVVLMKNGNLIAGELYDTANEQYYYKTSNGSQSNNQYIVPDNWSFQTIDVKYSVLEQLNLYASRATIGTGEHEFKYDEATHSYNREYWGSGASRFDLRYICPIVVENSAVVSFNGLTIKDIGSTVLTIDRATPVCSHSHGTHEFWFNDDFHADYCDDCGKAIRKHSHSANNEHMFCVECGNFKNGLYDNGFEIYHPEYEKLLNNRKIYVNPDTGKKYMYEYAGTAVGVQIITGKDGKKYQYFSSAPSDGQIEEVTFKTNDTIESARIENSCFYFVKYNVIKSTYDMSYLALADENIPEEIYEDTEYLKAHYFNVTKELNKAETVDTVYSFPSCYHDELNANSEFTVISATQALKENNYLYLEFKYYGVMYDVNSFTFVKVACPHCRISLYAAYNESTPSYIVDTFGARNSSQKVGVTYTWNDNNTECVGKFILITQHGYDDPMQTIIATESAVVVNDTEESTITATFTNPLFKTQTQHYYGN